MVLEIVVRSTKNSQADQPAQTRPNIGLLMLYKKEPTAGLE